MRLLTHNQLMCVRRSCTLPYPLALEAAKVEREQSDVNLSFINHVFASLDYNAFHDTVVSLGLTELPPPSALHLIKQQLSITSGRSPTPVQNDSVESILDTSSSSSSSTSSTQSQDSSMNTEIPKNTAAIIHSYLMDIHIIDGALVCKGCKRRYPIQQGIPNMRLNEDEV